MEFKNLGREDIINMAYGRVYKGSAKKMIKAFGATLFFTGIGASLYYYNRFIGSAFLIAGICFFLKLLWDYFKLSQAKDRVTQDLLKQWVKESNASLKH